MFCPGQNGVFFFSHEMDLTPANWTWMLDRWLRPNKVEGGRRHGKELEEGRKGGRMKEEGGMEKS
jgi:hypothetical protein